MNKYILDRIESNIAILEAKNGEYLNISLSALPQDVREGDILLFENGKYNILAEETIKYKEKLKKLRNSLRED